MECIYTNFAYVYDKLMYDIDYKKWADFIEKVIDSFNVKPELVLDLGCGTGSFCIEMARRGYEMIGLDLSADMLSCARDKASGAGVDILFLNQDMTEFELYGTVDVITCLLDSVNYITDKRMLKKLFKLVKNYLNPGGLFIFDINTPYKLENILGENVFYDIGDDITYIWQNSFDKNKDICRFDLTFFVKEDNFYKRYDEVHFERAYKVHDIEKMLAGIPLLVVAKYDGLSLGSPKAKSERIFFICKN